MDRTLFSPAMIQTYQKCKKLYELKYMKTPVGEGVKLSTITKRILKKGFAEVHRGQITTVPQAQQWIGQHWPNLDSKADPSEPFEGGIINSFRFALRVLTAYAVRPYEPAASQIAAVNIKLRARIPHSNTYIEDVFDLVLWHPHEETLEIVDYHISALQVRDEAWPPADILIKQFLVQKIHSRYPFKRIKMTFGRFMPSGMQYKSFMLDDALFRLHWPEIERTIEEMKSAHEFKASTQEFCARCPFADSCPSARKLALATCEERRDITYRSA